MAIFASTTILNKYRIVRQIGQGGMGRVWLAEEMIFGNRPVAIKEARSDLPQSELEDVQRRYKQEVEIYAALQREQAPHIVPVYTVEPYEESALLVMAYMPNGDLDAALRQQGGGLPPARALEITAALLLALRAAHEHVLEIVHRDIKPSNLLFDEANRAHLADFGLAQLGGTSNRSQAGGTRKHPGTPAYMAPEQADSTEYLAPAADIYAVGCVLFEMLTGKRYKRVRPDTKPSALRPETPAWVDALVGKALAQDRYDRYEDAGEMLAALQAGRTQFVTEQERRAEAERQRQIEVQRQAEIEAAAQAEIERQRQIEAERQAEAERARRAEAAQQAEAQKERQAEVEAARQAEIERQRQIEAERQRQLEMQREAEAERQRQAIVAAESQRQRQAEAERARTSADIQQATNLKVEQEKRTTVSPEVTPPGADALPPATDTSGASLIPSKETLSIILKMGLAVFWLVTGFVLLLELTANYDYYDYALRYIVYFPAFLFWAALGQWIVLQRFLGPSRWWLTYSAGASVLAAVLVSLLMIFGSTTPWVPIVELLVVSSIQWFGLRRYVKKAFLWIIGSVLGFLPLLRFLYFLASIFLLRWLLKYQSKQSTAADNGDDTFAIIHLWRRIAGPPAGKIGVIAGAGASFPAAWAGFTALFVVSMLSLFATVIRGMPYAVILMFAMPLLLFGAAAGQWLIIRRQLTGSAWWLLYSAAGAALAVAVGFLGNWLFVSGIFGYLSTPEGLLIVSLQLLVVAAGQWLKLRYYVNHAYLWMVASVLGGAATWYMLFTASSGGLTLPAIIGAFVYPVVTGAVMWRLIKRQAKRR